MRQTGILSVIFLFLAILSACGDKTQSGYEAPEVSESSDQEEASAVSYTHLTLPTTPYV